MAKELPYFKFEPGEWETGNIQLVDFETQGIFINICSIYWQRLGDLPYKLAVQKVCGGNATALQSLSDENIIEVIEGKIYIKFLDEQLSEFENTSNQNRENALKRWRKKRDATAKQSQSDGNASREEKIREDKNLYSEFYDKQIEISNNDKYYLKFVKYLFGENDEGKKLNGVLSIRDQLTYQQFIKVYEEAKVNKKKISDVLLKIENDKKYYKGKVSLYRTLLNWIKDSFIK